ncbi:hypothetical protein [uncultured Anaerococcus sp.]|uniref:hypothetical protein n=1 Tax=uncultured Anaerococcus sp. TaxID=293428 RepID=UPI0025E1F816|nr:hypothetical protein [uncultured Anaerococcus sp.]
MDELIIAILPEYVKGKGIYSRVYSENGPYLDRRGPSLFLKNLYYDHHKDKQKIDKHIKTNYQIHRNLPYVIDSNSVFFPFKFRKSDYDKETRAFVNVKYVDRIEDSEILLITGERLSSLATEKALIASKNLAQALMYEEMIKMLNEQNTTIRFLTAKMIG